MTDTGRRKPGRPPLVENRRQAILDSAARQFAEVGFEKTSLRELAAAMGVSKATVYHYFQTKQEIYDAIIVDALRGLAESVEAALDGVTGAEARLRVFMTAQGDFFERHYWFFVTMLIGLGGMHSADMRAEALLWRRRHEGTLRAIIRDGVAAGELRPVDPAVTGRAVLSMLSWMVRWYRPGGPQSAAAIAADYHDLLVRGLRPAADPA